MTLYLSLKLINKFNIQTDIYIPITNPFLNVSEIIGTSANLP